MYTYKIIQDEYPENPRTNYDHIGTIAAWHRRDNLGDEQPSQNPGEWLRDLADKYLGNVPERVDYIVDQTYRWDDNYVDPLYGTKGTYRLRWAGQKAVDILARAREKAIEDHYVLFPLYLYDHSGLMLSTSSFSCPWDSGQVGYIYASYDKLRKEYGTDATKEELYALAERIFRCEIEEYSYYLNGEAYGYVIKDEDGEEVDSCWGYLGYQWAEEAAQEALKCVESVEV